MVYFKSTSSKGFEPYHIRKDMSSFLQFALSSSKKKLMMLKFERYVFE